MKRTKTYGLGSFEAGDFIIPVEEKNRFVTLDYHLDTYVGIVGNGIAKGWTIRSVSGLTIEIEPGSGFISSYYSESPYALDPYTESPLVLSVAQSLGYTIGEQIPGWSSPAPSYEGSFYQVGGSPDSDALVFKQLGPDGEDKNYDGIIDGVLAPVYQTPPATYFTNPYVKSYAPVSNQLTLPDNSDSYIFAKRVSATDPSKTFVSFSHSLVYSLSSSNVFLGKVTTRSGQVSNVDTSLTFSLNGGTGPIGQMGAEIIRNHIHGGSSPTDPPKIQLKTDIRNCVPEIKLSDGRVKYNIVSSENTGISLNHSHTFYEEDGSGTGYTVEVNGTYEFHYHHISGGITIDTVTSIGSSIPEHAHTIDSTIQPLNEASSFAVYVNNKLVDSSQYNIDTSTGEIIFNPGIVNLTYPAYSCTFNVNLPTGVSGTSGSATIATISQPYSFYQQTASAYLFLLNMYLDFNSKTLTLGKDSNGNGPTYTYSELSNLGYSPINPDATIENTPYYNSSNEPLEFWLRSPFDFWFYNGTGTKVENERDEQGNFHTQDWVPISTALPSGSLNGKSMDQGDDNDENLYGIEDMYAVSLIADANLEKIGDKFFLFPRVGKWISIELMQVGYSDKVFVEVLDNVEVSGILKQDNIYFIEASKFLKGQFDQARIPFLSHLGRMNESFVVQQSGTTTVNGIKFVPSAYVTDLALGHSHRMYMDADGKGTTLATLVNNKIAVWEYNAEQKIDLITHSHSIQNGIVASAQNASVNDWIGVDPSTIHTHVISKGIRGTARSVFSIAEDKDGNLLMGASDGVWVLPSGLAYLISVGNYQYYSYNQELGDAIATAFSRYSDDTGNTITVGASITSQIPLAESVLTSTGDSYAFGGSPTTSVSVVAYAKIDNLYIETQKFRKDIEPYETLIRVISPGETSDEDFCLVRQFLDDRAFWQITINGDSISLVSYEGVIVGSQVSGWVLSNIPPFTGIVRRVAVAGAIPEAINSSSSSSNSIVKSPVMLMATSNMPAISRNNGASFVTMSHIANENCFDTAVVDENWFLLATDDGVYRVNVDGTVSKTLQEKYCRNLAIDYSNPGGAKAYCLISTGKVLSSLDGGITWSDQGSIPTEVEFGKLLPMFGNKLVATANGISTFGNDNKVVLEKVIRCISWSNDGLTAFLGGDGFIYSTTDGVNFTEIVSFDGIPFPAVYIDGVRKFFGFAYNYNGGFCFEQSPSVSSKVSVATSFDIWSAIDGKWDSTLPYEILIGGTKVVSTESNIDLRGQSYPQFIVYPQSGQLDFSTSALLSAPANAGTTSLIISDTKISISEKRSCVISDIQGIVYTTVTSISNGTVLLNNGLSRNIAIPSTIRILSSLTADTEITGNFFSSSLSNVGINSHTDIENDLSNVSVGLPMRLSETYIGNLSALTMAAKRGLTTVDSSLINWETYGMNYSCNPGDPNYVGNDFDIEATLNGVQSLFGKTSGNSTSKTIRCVSFGYGYFDGMAFAGTDVGLFYAILNPSMDMPWFPISSCPVSDVFGVLVVGDGTLVVAGVGGVYKTAILGSFDKWNQVAAITEQTVSPGFLEFRWNGDSGKYWWDSWEGSNNTLSNNITNSIIAGGQNFVLISKDNGKTWSSTSMPFSWDFNANSFVSVSDGTALMSANSDHLGKSSILTDTVSGEVWTSIAQFPGINGTVSSCTADLAGNLEVSISYGSQGALFKNHSLTNLTAVVNGVKRVIADNQDEILILQGTETVPVGATISVDPLQINALAETNEGTILAGTNQGMMTDNGMHLSNEKTGGIINNLDKTAIVNSIDINGEVEGVQKQGENTTLLCSLNNSVKAGELVGKTIMMSTTIEPTISIISPLPGTNISSTSVTVTTSTILFEPGSTGYIEVAIDSMSPVYSSSNITTVTGVPAGQHTLTVTLVDKGNKAYANATATQSIVFSTSASTTTPSISVTSPVSGQVFSTTSIYINGAVLNFNANGGDGNLTYALDSGSSSTAIVGVNGTFSIPIYNLVNGNHSIRLSLVNVNGTPTGTYVDIPFIVSLTNSPYITVTSPLTGTLFVTSSVDISYSISNFSVPSQGLVKVSVDGASSVTSSNPSVITLTNLSNGSHIATLTLVDASLVPISSPYGTTSVAFSVNTTIVNNPSITITSPPLGTSYAAGTSVVNINFVTSNFIMPDNGGVIVQSGSSSVFSTSGSPYPFPVSGNGTYSVTMTLATSASSKLTNSEAQKTIAFTVGQSSTQSKAILVPSSAVTTNEVQSVSFTEQGTATAKSTSTSSLQGFVIVSNGASTANGQMTIVVSAILDSRSVGNTFRIVGKASTIYFSSSYPIASGEFAGGIMYVDYDESNNGGKTYSVVSNTSSSITLSVAITPPGNQQASSSTDITTVTTTPDVYEGETIRLVQSSGIGEAWVTFDNPWDTNALVGQPITVVHNKGGTSYGVIISNTSRTIMVTGINRAHYSSGDLFTFSMPIFIPVPSFSMTDTTIDLDHYHSNNLVGEWIRGGISSISLLSSSEAIAVITVSNPSGLANPLLVANPTLLQGEKITFYSPDGTIAFQETVSLVYPTSIVIDVVNANDWNLNGFGSYGINSTYLWEIDASAYGQTANPTYVDFIVYSTKLIQNAALGSSILNVPDPSKFINGDMVEIFDSSGTIQSATVISSISYVTISVPLQKTFSMTNGASVRILRNSFPENHTHMIKNGEVYSASVEEYQAVGYPLSHNHVLTSSLSNVACLKSDGLGRTYAGGSSNEILVTLDGGNTWQESISLNDLCSNTTCIGVDYTGKVAVGTGCGFIAAQATSLNEEANPVEVPIIDDSSSSSESSESSSSNSSSSSSSKSSISSSSSLSSNVFLG